MDIKEILTETILINIMQYALKYAASLVGDVKHYLGTVEIENFEALTPEFLDKNYKEGLCLQSVGQFSKYGHVFQPFTNLPLGCGFQGFQFQMSNLLGGQPTSNVNLQLASSTYPVSSMPSFELEGFNLGFIYPGMFNCFLAPWRPNYNTIVNAGIPVLTKIPLETLTEKLVEYNLAVVKLPYEILGSLLHITKENYDYLEKNLKTIILMDCYPQNYIRVYDFSRPIAEGFRKHDPNLKHPEFLYGNLFMSLHVEKLQEENLKTLVALYEGELRKVYNEFFQKNSYTMEMSTLATEVKEILLAFEHFAIMTQSSGKVILAMPADFVKNYYANSEKFKKIAELTYKLTCQHIGDERKVSVDFVYDFESGFRVGDEILKGEVIEQIMDNKPNLRSVKGWLQNKYKSKL